MTNEQYLVLSYFLVAALCLGLGTVCCLFLRTPLHILASNLPWKNWTRLLTRLFPVGILLPVLMGFASVSYRGCNVQSYDQILRNRAYLVNVNHHQLRTSILYLICAVLIWDAMLLLVMVAVRRSRNGNDRPMATSKES